MKWWLIGSIAAVVLLIAAFPLFSGAAWVGSKTLSVEVMVVDTEVPCGVANAQVVTFRGPPTLWEGRIDRRKAEDFVPDWDSPETKKFVTDSNGHCSFEYRFWPAAGMSSWYRNSGYVDTSKTWLRVSAEGRPTTLVPLDGQSYNPRDIHNKSPIMVTVVLNKNHSDDQSEAGASR